MPSFSFSGEIFYCRCRGCDNQVTKENGLCFFCEEAGCNSDSCDVEGFQGLRRNPYRWNPYTDEELVVTSLMNFARAAEYKDSELYNTILDALNNVGPVSQIVETKTVAMQRLLAQARQGGPRQEKYIPQIQRVLAELKDGTRR